MTVVSAGGHRGLGCTDGEYARQRNAENHTVVPPENTLDSHMRALRGGARFVETDLIPTVDDEIALTHSNDPQQHIIVAQNLPANKTFIDEMTLAEVKTLRTGPAGDGRICSLMDLLRAVTQEVPPADPFTLNLELKGVQATPRPSNKSVAALALKIIREENFPLQRIRFSSFSTNMLEDMAKREPKARLGQLYDLTRDMGGDAGLPMFIDSAEGYLPFNVSTVGETLARLPHLEAVHPEIQSLTPETAAFCAKQGLAVATWGWKENTPLHDSKFAAAAENAVRICQETGIRELSLITDHVVDMQTFIANHTLAFPTHDWVTRR